MVKSKYGVYTYLNLFFNFLFIGVIISTCLILDPWEKSKKIPIPKFLLGIFLLIFILFFLYRLLKIVLKISIENKRINIKGAFTKQKEITETEIVSIDLFSKSNYYWFIGLTTIATKIELSNGEKIMIADPFYRNIGEMKQTIVENFKEKIIPYTSERKIKSSSFSHISDFEKIAGNPYTCFNTLLLMGMVALFFLMQFMPGKVSDIKFASLIMSVVLYFWIRITNELFLNLRAGINCKKSLLFLV